MENVDIARFRRAFDAWSRGDVDAALGDVAPDFVLRDHVIPEGTEGPMGPEAVRANHAQLLAGFDRFTIEPLEFEEIEDGMLVRVRAVGHTERDGGLDVELEAGQLWRLRDGAALPVYMTSGAAGCDLAAAIEAPVMLRPLERALVEVRPTQATGHRQHVLHLWVEHVPVLRDRAPAGERQLHAVRQREERPREAGLDPL